MDINILKDEIDKLKQKQKELEDKQKELEKEVIEVKQEVKSYREDITEVKDTLKEVANEIREIANKIAVLEEFKENSKYTNTVTNKLLDTNNTVLITLGKALFYIVLLLAGAKIPEILKLIGR